MVPIYSSISVSNCSLVSAEDRSNHWPRRRPHHDLWPLRRNLLPQYLGLLQHTVSFSTNFKYILHINLNVKCIFYQGCKLQIEKNSVVNLIFFPTLPLQIIKQLLNFYLFFYKTTIFIVYNTAYATRLTKIGPNFLHKFKHHTNTQPTCNLIRTTFIHQKQVVKREWNNYNT